MIDDTGHRHQESLRAHPYTQGQRNFDKVLRGMIIENGVHYKDKNAARQTLVDIALLGGYPNIYGVPLVVAKTNQNNGVEWTPDPGDAVLVMFVGGNWQDPVVIGFVPLADDAKDSTIEKPHNPGVLYSDGVASNVQAREEDAPIGTRRYHMRCNKTDIQIDKSGNRITAVEGFEDQHVKKYRTIKVEQDDRLEVQGNGTIIIHGNMTVHIYGTADITVDGNTTVTTPNATVNASGQVELNTPLTHLTGDLTVAGDINAAGDITDGTRSMVSDRGIYNTHTHDGAWSGGGTTDVPNQQE